MIDQEHLSTETIHEFYLCTAFTVVLVLLFQSMHSTELINPSGTFPISLAFAANSSCSFYSLMVHVLPFSTLNIITILTE